MFYIRRDDEFGLYDDDGSFKEERFENSGRRRRAGHGMAAHRTGKLALNASTIGKQARHYPELETRAEAARHHRRAAAGPFPQHRRRGRLQPMRRSCRSGPGPGAISRAARDKVFLLSLPSWTARNDRAAAGMGHGRCWIGRRRRSASRAGLSGDPALIADFQAGDPHMGFAIRAGLAPDWGDQARATATFATWSSRSARQSITACRSTAPRRNPANRWHGRPPHSPRIAMPIRCLSQWQQDRSRQALFDERIASVFGWPMAVHAGTNERTLLNYRPRPTAPNACGWPRSRRYEAGIKIAAPAHDAFWIMAPLSELDDTIAAMTEIMVARRPSRRRHRYSGRVSPPWCAGRSASATCASRKPRARRCGPRSRHCSTAAPASHGGIMKKRRAKLYLVGQDPADIFDDLDKLGSDLTSPRQRRPRATETFARIPHDKALALYKHRLSPAAWVVLIELDRLILKAARPEPGAVMERAVAHSRAVPANASTRLT